jgi:hypothetical protein
MGRYLIIIARDRPDLLGRLAVIYGQKGEVEIHFDRRQGQAWTAPGDRPDRRAPRHRDSVLRKQGFLVIRRPETAAASR